MGAAVIAGITWVAGVVPTSSKTHVDIWPPIVIVAILFVIGLYVVLAADLDSKWFRLPGHRRVHEESVVRQVSGGYERLINHSGERDIARELRDISESLKHIVDHLPFGDGNDTKQ